MSVKELLDAGRLAEAIDFATREVKAKPADRSSRSQLFELLCFQGELDRAEKQLDAMAAQTEDVKSELAIHGYKQALQAERLRREVFEGQALPKFFMQPPSYVEDYVLLTRRIFDEQSDLGEVVAAAEESFDDFRGELNGKTFTSFRDGDDRTAPVLEVIHGSDYLWVALGQIRRLEISAPRKLRDLFWIRSRVETFEKSLGDVYVPVIYPGSWKNPDDRVKLGQLTQWESVRDRMVCGAGQRVFLVDAEQVPLLSIRELEFEPQEVEVS